MDDTTLTWERDGLTYTATPPPAGETVTPTMESKAKTGKWDAARAAKNPRDSKGRWIETGAEVRILGGMLGRVLGMGRVGKTRVKRTDGQTVEVDNDQLTVTQSAPGSTLKPSAAPGAPGAPGKPAPGKPAAPAPRSAERPQTPGHLAEAARQLREIDLPPNLSRQERTELTSALGDVADALTHGNRTDLERADRDLDALTTRVLEAHEDDRGLPDAQVARFAEQLGTLREDGKAAYARDKPGEKPEAAQGKPSASSGPIASIEALREHWSSGGQSNPDLSDSQREFLRTASQGAHDIQLSEGGALVLFQRADGGPWQVSNHHGLAVGPPQPDADKARALARALENDLLDADGNPLDFNTPGFGERAGAFRTADGLTVGAAVKRIIAQVQGPDGDDRGDRGDGGGGTKPPADPQLSEALAAVRQVQEWKPLNLPPEVLTKRRGAIRGAAGDLADALEAGDAHAVITAFDHYSAVLNAVSYDRTLGSHDLSQRGRRGPSETDAVTDLRARAQEAYLRWRAADPNGGRPQGPRFTTLDQVRDHLADGGEESLIDSSGGRAARRVAAKIGPDTQLVGDGSFIAVQDGDEGTWRLRHSATGQEVLRRKAFATPKDAADFADELKGYDHDWDHPGHFLTPNPYDVFDLDGAYEEFQQERGGRTPDKPEPKPKPDKPEPKPEPKPKQTPTLDTPQAVRDYWESGGQGDERLTDGQRRTMRQAASKYVEIRPSDDGGLVLARDKKSGPWQVVTQRGSYITSERFSNLERARDMARRLEALTDADGTRMDWGSLDYESEQFNFRTGEGENYRDAIERLAIVNRRAFDAPGKNSKQGVTRVGDAAAVRAYWAKGGDENTGDFIEKEGQRESHRGHMRWNADNVEDIRVSPGGQLVLTHVRQGSNWEINTVDAVSVLKEFPSEKKARDFAAELEALTDADGKVFDWQGPMLGERIKTFRTGGGESIPQAIARIKRGEPAPQPPDKPEPKPKQTPTLDTPQAVRDYWAAGGRPGDTIPNRDTLSFLAQDAHDIRLSESGALVLVQDRKGGKWRLTSLHGGPLPDVLNQSSATRALQMAARMEALRDADGQPFDFNADRQTFTERLRTWRTADHLDLRAALDRAVDEQRQANKPKPKPKPDPVEGKLTPPGQPITSIDQVRAHLAAGGDEADLENLAREIANAPDLELAGGNSFIVRPIKPSQGRKYWIVHHARTGRGATPGDSKLTREEAIALAERLKGLRNENGKRFDWDAPDANKRLGSIPNLNEQIRAIIEGRDPDKPRPKPDPIKPKLISPGNIIATVDDARAHLAAGGDDPDPDQQAMAKRIANAEGMELDADHVFIVRPIPLGGGAAGNYWALNHAFTGRDFTPRQAYPSRQEALDLAKRLQGLHNENGQRFDWYEPDLHKRMRRIPNLSDQLSAIEEGQEPPLPPLPDSEAPELSTPQGVRAYWAAGGRPGARYPPPDALRELAASAHDLRLSPGGNLVLVQKKKGSAWQVMGLHGDEMNTVLAQTSLPRALQVAERLEALRDADGAPYDFNLGRRDPRFAEQSARWRTDRGEDIGAAVKRVAAAQKEANKQEGSGEPPAATFASPEQLREHYAAALKAATDPEVRAHLKTLMSVKTGLRLSPGGGLVAYAPNKGMWSFAHADSGLRLGPHRLPNRAEADDYLKRLEAIRGADGKPVSWAVDAEGANALFARTWRSHRGATMQQEIQQAQRETDLAHGRPAEHRDLDEILREAGDLTPPDGGGDGGGARSNVFDSPEQLRAHYGRLAETETDETAKERLTQLADPKTPMILSENGSMGMYSLSRGEWIVFHAGSGVKLGPYGVTNRAEAVEYLRRMDAIKGADGQPFPWHAPEEEVKQTIRSWRSHRGASFQQEIDQVQREHALAHDRPTRTGDLDQILREQAERAERERQEAQKAAALAAWKAGRDRDVAAEPGMGLKPLHQVAEGDEVVVHGRIGTEINMGSKTPPDGLSKGDLVELRGSALTVGRGGEVTSLTLHTVTYRTPDGRTGEFADPGAINQTSISARDSNFQVFSRTPRLGEDDGAGKPPLPPAHEAPDAATVADAVRDTLDDPDTAQKVRALHEALSVPDTPTEEVTEAWSAAGAALGDLMDRLDQEGTQEGWDKAAWVESVTEALQLRVHRAGHDAPDRAELERRAQYAARTDADLRAAVNARGLSGDERYQIELELERRGYNSDGSPAENTPHDMADPQRPSDAVVGRHIVINTARGPEIWRLEREGDDFYATQPGHGEDSARRRQMLDDEQWIDPIQPGDPRLASLAVGDYATGELDGELNRLAGQIQELWAAERRRGDDEFDTLFGRYNEVLGERQRRPDPEPEAPRQDEALLGEGGEIADEARPPVIDGGGLKPKPTGRQPGGDQGDQGGRGVDERRFATLDAVKDHLRTLATQVDLPRRDWSYESDEDHDKRQQTRRAYVEKLAEDPTLTLSAGGRLVIHQEARGQWQIIGVGSVISAAPKTKIGSKKEALELAAKLEAITDADGKPVEWDSPDLVALNRTWRGPGEEKLTDASIRVIGQHQVGRGRLDDPMAHAWLQRQAKQDAAERQARYAAMGDGELRELARTGEVDRADLELRLELERRGLRRDGSPAPFSRHDMVDAQPPSDALVGRHVLVHTQQGTEILTLERDGDSYRGLRGREHPETARSGQGLDEDDWVDPIPPGDPRLAGIRAEEYSTAELDGELDRLAGQIQALWAADRRRGDPEFDALYERHNSLQRERQDRPVGDLEPLGQDEALLGEGGQVSDEARPPVIDGGGLKPKPRGKTPPPQEGEPFTDVEQLRAHLRGGGEHLQDRAARLAADPELTLAGGGAFAVTRADRADGGRGWTLSHARSGADLNGGEPFQTREQAELHARRLTTMGPVIGKPYDWNRSSSLSVITAAQEQLNGEGGFQARLAAIHRSVLPPPGGSTHKPGTAFKDVDEVRALWQAVAADPDTAPSQAAFLTHLAREDNRKHLALSPGGHLVLSKESPQEWSLLQAETALSIEAKGIGGQLGSEWGGKKAAAELARRYEAILGADGKPLDWSGDHAAITERFKTWRADDGENLITAITRVKGQWDHENGKDTQLAGWFTRHSDTIERPVFENRVYGDEVKPGDYLHVRPKRGAASDKKVTAVERVGWGAYQVSYEDGTQEVYARNQPLLRALDQRAVLGDDGEVIGENVPAGALKPGDRIRITADIDITFNAPDLDAISRGGIRDVRRVTVEGTVAEGYSAAADERGYYRAHLSDVTITSGRHSVTLPNTQRDRQGRQTSYRFDGNVVRFGGEVSEREREQARLERLAAQELDHRDQALTRIKHAYSLGEMPSEVTVPDAGELARRRAELAEADREDLDRAAARLRARLDAKAPAGEVVARVLALDEAMTRTGHTRPFGGQRGGWALADQLAGKDAPAMDRELVARSFGGGEKHDANTLAYALHLAEARGDGEVAEALRREQRRRIEQPDTTRLPADQLVEALARVDAPYAEAARDLLEALEVDKPDPERVEAAWARADAAYEAAAARDDLSAGARWWVGDVNDELQDRMRRANFRPTDAEARERRARYGQMSPQELRAELDRVGYSGDAHDDLIEELERRGLTEHGHYAPGSAGGMSDPRTLSEELVGRRVALHDGWGGWIQGYLHRRGKGKNAFWSLSDDPEDHTRNDRRLRNDKAFVEVVRPGHPSLADLERGDYSTPELEGELNRLAGRLQELWKGDRRRGDSDFDELFDRYNELVRERQERPEGEAEPPRQDESLLDESGRVADEARPPVRTVGADKLAVDDRLADGSQIEEVTRVGDLVFITVRDDDDRRRVRAFEPGEQVGRLAASGRSAPAPLTSQDTEARHLSEGDRVLVERPDGARLPATVLSVESEGDTQVLEVRYDDASTQTVMMDRRDTLTRLGGPEAGAQVIEPDPEPREEPPAGAGPVDASQLKVGDRITFPSGDVYKLVAVDQSGRDTEVRVRRERDGVELDFGFGKTQKVHRLGATGDSDSDSDGDGGGGERVSEPEQLPEGTVTARPVFYTYQRRNLNWLGLEASEDAAVRQAALRIRERLPLSAEQAAALADAVRARSQSPEVKPVQQRAMGRLAYSLDAAAAQARGVPKPRKPAGRDTPFKAYAKNLVEGDMVALPVPRGRAKVGKITAMRRLMGGRMIEIDVEYGDGSTERRLVTAKTDTYVLPDLPDDVPLPPAKSQTEHIMPDQVAVGDVLRRMDGTEREVTSLEWGGQGSSRIAHYGPGDSDRLDSPDGGPTVVRVRRGAASTEQPWGPLIDDDPNPPTVTSHEVNLGDRVSVLTATRKYPVVGTVVDIKDMISKGAAAAPGTVLGKIVTVRSDHGDVERMTLMDAKPARSITRLKAADANIVERIREQQRQEKQQKVIRQISQVMAFTAKDIYENAAALGLLGAGTSETHALMEIDKADFKRVHSVRDPVGGIIGALGVTDATSKAEMRKRLTPIVDELMRDTREHVKKAVQAARPLPGENEAEARRRVLNQYYRTPPTDLDAFWSPASTLAEVREVLAGSDTSAEKVMASVPEVGHIGDLATRIGAYREALGDGANFGKARVRRAVMAETTLADLDNGKVPAVDIVDVPVPDVAADGGPGEIAMQHLAIVRAAGRDLDDSMQRMLREVGVQKWEAEIAEHEAIIGKGIRNRSFGKLLDQKARELGYTSPSDMARRDRDAYQKMVEEADKEYAHRAVQVSDLTKRIADERRRAALAVLGQVREDGMGGKRLDWYEKSPKMGYYKAGMQKPTTQLTEKSELVKAMRFAEDSYPRTWLELFQARADKMGRNYQLSQRKRGSHNSSINSIALSVGVDQTTKGGVYGDVAVHEMGHGMELAVPGMLEAQRVFLWSRTSTGEIGSRAREKKESIYDHLKKKEYGYRDSFPEHYTGKDYISSTTGKETAFEVLTTGMESLMAGSQYLDDDFRQWLLGTLALLGTPEKPKPMQEIYGKNLRVKPGPTGAMHLQQMERIPAPFHEILKKHLKGGIDLGDGYVTDYVSGMQDRYGQPRGWPPGKSWDRVAGVYIPDMQRVVIGGTVDGSTHGSVSVAVHENAHALDHALGQASRQPDFRDLHAKALDRGVKPYYAQTGDGGPSEMWAEAFAAWILHRNDPPAERNAAIAAALGMPRGAASMKVAAEVFAYYNKILKDAESAA